MTRAAVALVKRLVAPVPPRLVDAARLLGSILAAGIVLNDLTGMQPDAGANREGCLDSSVACERPAPRVRT